MVLSFLHRSEYAELNFNIDAMNNDKMTMINYENHDISQADVSLFLKCDPLPLPWLEGFKCLNQSHSPG